PPTTANRPSPSLRAAACSPLEHAASDASPRPIGEEAYSFSMTLPFRRAYRVQWADLDAIGHLRNSAYLDYAVDTRFSYLAEQGFTAADFAAAGIGPVVLLDEIRYRRELRFQEDFTVTFALAGLSADGSRL